MTNMLAICKLILLSLVTHSLEQLIDLTGLILYPREPSFQQSHFMLNERKCNPGLHNTCNPNSSITLAYHLVFCRTKHSISASWSVMSHSEKTTDPTIAKDSKIGTGICCTRVSLSKKTIEATIYPGTPHTHHVSGQTPFTGNES
jgi:hypothetical protein